MNCPQCHQEMKQWSFDIGYGVKVPSKHCEKCQFNVTDQVLLRRQLAKLRDQMRKQVKVVAVGDGLGIRFPKEYIDRYAIKKGNKLTVQPGKDGLEVIL